MKMRVPEKLSRNSRGVQPFFFLKIRLKFEILLKPQIGNFGNRPWYQSELACVTQADLRQTIKCITTCPLSENG
jgi:hypothetical protein